MSRDITRQTFGRVRRFVRGEGVRMFFQPITDLDTGSVIGFESLARFDSTPSGSARTWFDEAATAGLRRELELTTARAALSALADIPQDAYLTVNASPDVAMDPAFLASIPETSARRLVVEITEHAPITDYDAFNAALETLRSRGVRVAIDDAGAGFANMTHILRIHPDLIKLDVELTRHIDIDAQRRALVRSLVEFARSVGATLVAEGIETEAELLALRSLGVAVGQGYHLGRPEPLPGREAVAAHERPNAGVIPWVALALADASSYLRTRRIARRARGRRGGALRPAIAAVVGWLVLAPAGLAYADNSAPGDAGYWLKRRIESVRLIVALDRQNETRLHLEFARRRMGELSELLADGRTDLASIVLDNYSTHVDAVAGSLVASDPTPPGLRARIERDLNDNVAALDGNLAALCPADGGAKACGSAEVAISRSKRALKRSENAPRNAPKPNAVTPAPRQSPDPKPKSPNAKGASSPGHQQNPN